VNAQTVEENEIIENTLSIVEKAIAGIVEISKAMKNASKLITNSNEIKGDHDSLTLEQLKIAQKLNQAELESSSDSSSNKLKIAEVELLSPTIIDFSKILKDDQSLIKVEYQSEYSVVLRGDEETLLLLNGTLMPFWYAIDIVKKHGYQLKEITESGMGSKENPTRFYAILEKE
jgi:hypothetical protein